MRLPNIYTWNMLMSAWLLLLNRNWAGLTVLKSKKTNKQIFISLNVVRLPKTSWSIVINKTQPYALGHSWTLDIHLF